LNRFNPLYYLFLEDGKQHLLTAQKRSSSKTSNYLLSLHRTTVDRRSALVVAKLRANWSGSAYTLFDGGLNPARTATDTSVRKILGLIECAYDEMGPGRLNVRLPSVHENGSPSIQWKDTACHDDHAARKAFESTLDATSLLLRNKRPEYVAASGGHVLDFHGRVNMPSVKNFQMQSDVRI
jgi:tubby and related proteins